MIIVTGASRGLGNAICKSLVADGKKVLGLSRSEERFDWESMTCDVTSQTELKM